MKRRGWIILGILVLLVVSLALYRYYQGLGTLAPMSEPERPVVIALFGVDKKYDISGESVKDATTADSVVVAFLKETPRSVTFLVFPGNVLVDEPEWEGRMIGEVFALGGVDGVLDSLQRAMGVPIAKYVSVDYQGFVELINVIGGISVVIGSPMVFVDSLGGFEATLDAGTQQLDGEQALAYARFVEDAKGEVARLERHKQIILQIIKQVMSRFDVSKVDDVFSIVKSNVVTDLSLDDFLRLASYAKDLTEDDISIMLIPGALEENHWVIDQEGLEGILLEAYGTKNVN